MKPFGVFIIVPAPTRTRDSENIRIQKVVLLVIFEMYMLRYNFVFLYIYEYILSPNTKYHVLGCCDEVKTFFSFRLIIISHLCRRYGSFWVI